MLTLPMLSDSPESVSVGAANSPRKMITISDTTNVISAQKSSNAKTIKYRAAGAKSVAKKNESPGNTRSLYEAELLVLVMRLEYDHDKY